MIEERRREALARELHSVIRHGQSQRRVRTGDVVERAICVFDELARAARITRRVWGDALDTIWRKS